MERKMLANWDGARNIEKRKGSREYNTRGG
jgi:hypothetical protein